MKLIRTSTIPISLNVLLKGQLHFLSKHFETIAVSGSGEDLEAVRLRENVEVHPIQIERNISPLKDLVSLIKLYFYFRKTKPQIVHSITPKAGLLSMVAAKLAKVPIRIHTFTGLIFPTRQGMMKKILILMDQVLCASATHIYPEGQGVKNDLVQYKITSKPLKVIANGNVNGIDVNHFDPDSISEGQKQYLRESLGLNADDFIFIFVGRLVGDKGINELIDAFSKLRKSIHSKNPKLLLVGPLEMHIDALNAQTLNEIETNTDIISVGFQSDVRPYLAIADCLAFPSYREGFPNVVMQAGAMKLPSIVTDINGCNEIILNDLNGMIVPVKQSEALLNAMKKMMDDGEFYKKTKEQARSMIVSRYEQSVVWDAILEEYKAIIKEKNV